MIVEFRAATDADRDAWQRLLATCASGDFLHDWAWADVAAFDGEPQRRFVLEVAGETVAVAAPQVRRTFLGRSFWYVPHGPVLDYADPRAVGWLGEVIAGLRAAARSDRAVAVKLEPRLEARTPEARAFDAAWLRPTGEHVQIGRTRIVELPADDDALLAGFDKDTRYAIRRAEREGVGVTCAIDAADTRPIDDLHALVAETQRRAGFALPPRDRYRIAWAGLAGAGRAVIVEARRGGELLASGLLVAEGDRSFYLFSGSRREAPGEPKHYASYAMQWEMMRTARSMGSRHHDLWGIAPEGAGSDHPWHGVALFKKGFGGRAIEWAGSWDIAVQPALYALRSTADGLKRRLRPGRS
ncbi:MAG: lipid II:glycine glycyltransferase FemX [Candidatus Limnocylindria bacterium]